LRRFGSGAFGVTSFDLRKPTAYSTDENQVAAFIAKHSERGDAVLFVPTSTYGHGAVNQ
jgi:hypothetical protein